MYTVHLDLLGMIHDFRLIAVILTCAIYDIAPNLDLIRLETTFFIHLHANQKSHKYHKITID